MVAKKKREEIFIKEKTVSAKNALDFYEAIAKEVREKYGTDDPNELRAIARESDDLWLEEHIHDLEIYHAVKSSLRKSLERDKINRQRDNV